MPTMAVTVDEIRKTSIAVLAKLGVSEVEMEVSVTEIVYLVELAQEGKVEPIDTSDPAGGFGGVDLWIATVVPALFAGMTLRKCGALTISALDEAVDDVLLQVGSPRANQSRNQLMRAIRSALGIASSPDRG